MNDDLTPITNNHPIEPSNINTNRHSNIESLLFTIQNPCGACVVGGVAITGMICITKIILKTIDSDKKVSISKANGFCIESDKVS